MAAIYRDPIVKARERGEKKMRKREKRDLERPLDGRRPARFLSPTRREVERILAEQSFDEFDILSDRGAELEGQFR